MKKTVLLLALLALAPSYIDQLDADFTAGTATNINITNNTLILNTTSGNYTPTGTYLSNIKDLGSNPLGTIAWEYNSTTGTSIIITSRAGNTSSPDTTWTSYGTPYNDNTGNTLTYTNNRYQQYRVQLATTNNSNTPTIHSVTITYTEQGIIITPIGNTNLNIDYGTIYAYHFTITDTATIDTRLSRYRYGNNTWSNYTTIGGQDGIYTINVPEPGSGWEAYPDENLSINIYINDTTGTTYNQTIYERIDDVNHAPTIIQLNSSRATERTTKNFYITANDQDGDNISFGTSHGNITKTSNTTATITWTPTNSHVPNTTITVSATDGTLTSYMSFFVNVTDINTPPYIQPITDQTGHYGDNIAFTITVYDNDTEENLTYTANPDLFDIEPLNNSNASSTTYNAIANFTALDDHRGWHNITFFVRDEAGASTNTSATLNITYCGDNTCQEEENATSCREDCYEATPPIYLAVIVPDRLCANHTINLTTYNASSRYICYQDKRTTSSQGYCEPQERVEITIYKVSQEQRAKITTTRSNNEGVFSFTPTSTGEYTLTATLEDYISTQTTLTIKNCGEPIPEQDTVITLPKPSITANPRPSNPPPELQNPGLPTDDPSILSIIIWYIIIPVLGAALLYTGNAWYEINKDNNPTLLRARLKLWEYRIRITPIIKPYTDATWNAIKPAVEPVMNWLNKHIITPTKTFIKTRFKKRR